MIIKCEYCQKEFECRPSRFSHDKHHCCSRECSRLLALQLRENDNNYLNCECPICHKKFHLKESHKNKGKFHCCSRECFRKQQAINMAGERNHQYGLRGSKNASWKSDIKISKHGYILVRMLDHPFCDCDGFVRLHRLVAEINWLTPFNSVEINGKRYLDPKLEVHHIDGNKLNNDPLNLWIATKECHMFIHGCETRDRERNSKGQFLPLKK